MRTLVQFEYRKLWNRISIVAVMAMCILSTLHTFIYLDMNSQWRAIDKNGQNQKNQTKPTTTTKPKKPK